MVKKIVGWFVKKKLSSHEFKTYIITSIDTKIDIPGIPDDKEREIFSLAYDILIEKLINVL
jgi:hypothetical protein